MALQALAKQAHVAASPPRGEDCQVKMQLSQGCQMSEV